MDLVFFFVHVSMELAHSFDFWLMSHESLDRTPAGAAFKSRVQLLWATTWTRPNRYIGLMWHWNVWKQFDCKMLETESFALTLILWRHNCVTKKSQSVYAILRLWRHYALTTWWFRLAPTVSSSSLEYVLIWKHVLNSTALEEKFQRLLCIMLLLRWRHERVMSLL